MIMRVVVLIWLFGLVAGLGLSGVWSAVSAEAHLQVTVTAVTDGDSLRAGKLRLRLHGVDAPERKQVCTTASGQSYACGKRATDWLQTQLGPGARLSCAVLDIDRYRRLIVKCRTADVEINHALVRTGWAVAYTRYADDYLQAEQLAKADKAGLWQGTFDRPEDWRRHQRQASN